MSSFVSRVLTGLLCLTLAGCSARQGNTYKLYYLGGQSNMDGYGYVDSLPGKLTGPFDGVMIFHGSPSADDTPAEGKGIWTQLSPGHGAGFSSDGITNDYSNRFGIEMTFATKMRELDPVSDIAIVKYSKGGTSIDRDAARTAGCWDPGYSRQGGTNQYDHFLASYRNAIIVTDIDGDGKKDKLIPSGILWMQGESDGSVSEDIALKYYDNLTTLMGFIRNTMGNKRIPVVIGRISDSGNNLSGLVWQWGEIIRKAQMDFAINDPHAGIVVSTDSYRYSDPWHYDSEGFLDLGEQFAMVLDSLNKK